MGQDFKECWESAWQAVEGAFNQALAGRADFLENQRMFLDRYGYLEETFSATRSAPSGTRPARSAGCSTP
jgi:hypothetical protein